MNPKKIKTLGTAIHRFVELKNNESGLILINTKNEEFSIFFSDLKKIYIKKNKFNASTKIGLALLLLILISATSLTNKPEISFIPIMISVPLLDRINRYKWYHIHLVLQDETLYSKVFYNKKKQYYINTVNHIKRDLFYDQIKCNCKPEIFPDIELFVEDSKIPKLCIA